MDYEDIDRILNMVSEQNPEGFKSWLDDNYCHNCPNKLMEAEDEHVATY